MDWDCSHCRNINRAFRTECNKCGRPKGEVKRTAAQALNHPNIAQIYDVGENHIVMEFVDGEPLRPPDSMRKLVDVAVQIADGLVAAHSAGFIPRETWSCYCAARA